jgi:hypothetical protein
MESSHCLDHRLGGPLLYEGHLGALTGQVLGGDDFNA